MPVVFAVLLMAIEGSMLGALSYTVQPMFDRIFVAGNRDAIPLVAGAIAAIFVIRAGAAFGHKVLMYGAGLRILMRLQADMLAHLLTLDGAFFQRHPPGTLIERVRGDTSIVQSIWSTVLTALGRDVISLIALLAVAISIDPIWTLIAVASAPLLLIPIVALQRFVRKRVGAA
ncbi:MAG: ABC transporter transmembrane domain-containing protein, partial [Pseudomonadota bacterium]